MSKQKTTLMLHKTFCTVDQATDLPPNQALCIQVTTTTELSQASKILESKESLKGVQIPSSLLPLTPKQSKINFVSIILEKPEHTNYILTHLVPKQQFIELVISYKLCTDHLLKRLEGVKRVIIDFTKEDTTNISSNQIQVLFASLISYKYFPFTKGLNQDQVQLRHMIEFYQQKITTKQIQDTQQHALSIKAFLETKTKGDLL